MTDKPVDPLAGVEAATTRCKLYNHYTQYPPDERSSAACTCGLGEQERLLPEPAVRAAMVEWIRKEAVKLMPSGTNDPDPVRWEILRELALRLEAGGGGDDR